MKKWIPLCIALLGYCLVSPVAAQKEKVLLAKKLASRFEVLNKTERQKLVELAPFSFRPLLARYVEWASSFDSNSKYVNINTAYDMLTEVRPILFSTCRKEDTQAIVAALAKLGLKSEWRDTLESLLQSKGDQKGYIPSLVKDLRRLPLKGRDFSAALSAVSHSTHPLSVKFMLEALRDPKAGPAWRKSAFVHLAGMGGTEGVEAVRKARRVRSTCKLWYDRVDLIVAAHENLGNKKDDKGRTWMLFHSDILGNHSDLFVVEKLGSKWGRPLFTGVWTQPTWYMKAPSEFRGIPIKRLVSTEWIRIFPDDAEIRRDSDGDGLTDIVEARLGTDPNKADTDGDGIPDALDPCPNTAPRELGDTEKIIAACIEARFFDQDWVAPAVVLVDNVEPFELYGYPSTLIWGNAKNKSILEKFYSGGVNMIHFHKPNRNDNSSKEFIQYSDDHKRAATIISRYSGGLNGDGTEVTLVKIGDEWFVVELQGRYVS